MYEYYYAVFDISDGDPAKHELAMAYIHSVESIRREKSLSFSAEIYVRRIKIFMLLNSLTKIRINLCGEYYAYCTKLSEQVWIQTDSTGNCAFGLPRVAALARGNY